MKRAVNNMPDALEKLIESSQIESDNENKQTATTLIYNTEPDVES